MPVRQSLASPIGVLTVEATERGLSRVRFPRGGGSPPDAATPTSDAADDHLAAATQQLAEYFAGTRRDFDLSIDWDGVVGVRLRILELLCDVGFGDTTTYGALAKAVGEPQAAQLVGQVMGSNPVPVVVPCHRVLAADGLGGFGGGLATKQWLLGWEGVLAQQLDFG
jgi:methylated-DNA-[protein]-cysteine S-methyltransferase